MLWLKAWLETRWRLVWMLVVGVLLLGLPFEANRNPRLGDSHALLFLLLRLAVVLSLLAAIMLAGSGIQTVSTRPGAFEKGGEASTLFTLALPVKRTWLFAVRTVTGVLEVIALLAVFGISVIWLLVPPLMVSPHDALGYFAVMVSCSLAVYAISACLSTFCDEGWRFRGSSIAVLVLFVLANAGKLPRSVDIFRAFGATSPLVTHQIPWDAIAAACVLAVLFLAIALTIIQRRNY